jgi:uncharacterized protein involved in exopolysaccharide biosynthesis
MRDPWVRIVSEHLAGLDLPEDDRADVIEEVAAHLRESAEELEHSGVTDAVERTLAQVADWTRLAANIRRAKEEPMTTIGPDGRGQRTSQNRTRMFAGVVAVGVMLGAAAGLVTSWVAPVRYQSAALIQIRPAELSAEARTTGAPPLAARIEDIMLRVLSRTRLERVIVEFNLYPATRASKIMEEAVEQFRGDISIVATQPDVISVRYVGTDPTITMRVTEKLAAYLRDESQIEAERRSESQIDAERSAQGVSFNLLDQARVPDEPLGPTRLQRVGVGAAAGLAAGLVLALVLALVRFPSGRRPEPQTA